LFFGAPEGTDIAKELLKELVVQLCQSVEHDFLGRRRHAAIIRKKANKGFYFQINHFSRMTFALKANEILNPVDIIDESFRS